MKDNCNYRYPGCWSMIGDDGHLEIDGICPPCNHREEADKRLVAVEAAAGSLEIIAEQLTRLADKLCDEGDDR